jgi:hypothetical protein
MASHRASSARSIGAALAGSFCVLIAAGLGGCVVVVVRAVLVVLAVVVVAGAGAKRGAAAEG